MSATALSAILNEELIKRALQSYHQTTNEDALKLKAYSFKLSSASGDNFCSKVYQVEAEYEINGNTATKAFIVKHMIPEIAEMGSNEQMMFNIVLPGMEKCLNFSDNDHKNNNKLHAKCLISENDKDEYYVLENLNALGYYCADRIKGLDLHQALVVMNKIGKFHAASMVFAKKFPKVVESLRKSNFEHGASDASMQAIAFGGLEYVAKMIENWPSYKHLAPKILSLIPKFNSLVMQVVNPKNSKFNVINHGDLWVNNFLYKYDKDSYKPVDVVFVDFQASFWGSCAFDINWFLNTSLELKVLKDNRLMLIETYYDSLKQTLGKINYPTEEIPAVEDVLQEIERCEIISLYTSLCELPIVALDKTISQEELNCMTFTQPEKMQKLRVLMYENPRVKETLEFTLKYFEKINLL